MKIRYVKDKDGHKWGVFYSREWGGFAAERVDGGINVGFYRGLPLVYLVMHLANYGALIGREMRHQLQEDMERELNPSVFERFRRWVRRE